MNFLLKNKEISWKSLFSLINEENQTENRTLLEKSQETKTKLALALKKAYFYIKKIKESIENKEKTMEMRLIHQEFLHKSSLLNVCVTNLALRKGYIVKNTEFLCFFAISYYLQRKIEGNINQALLNSVFVSNQRDCIHERFSFMKELANNPHNKVNYQ